MTKPKDERYTVAVDFDGVIHSYTTPWVDAATIPDPPVPGAIDWLCKMLQRFDVAITSTRNHQPGGVEAMRAWLRQHGGAAAWEGDDETRGLAAITFPVEKPIALMYIDDRAWRFTGEFPRTGQILNARPWNKPRTKKEAR